VLEAILALGTQVIAKAVDVSDETALRALLARIRRDGPPLRGILHSAGALDDAALLQQDARRFDGVFAPKVRGGWLLDELTRSESLDWFVLFSSIAAVLGSAGQANHSAANAFLDALAHERRNNGLPALSINWGAWTEVGAAADRGLTERLRSQGLGAVTPDQGLLALQRLLESGITQAAVVPIDWRRYLERYAQSHVPEIFAHMTEVARTSATSREQAAAPADVSFPQQLAEAPESRRRPMLAAFVRERALRALGIDPSKPLDPRTPLGDLGLDSLLAVELRNTLGSALGRSLPATLLFDYPSIETLTEYLLTEVLALGPTSHEEAPRAAPSAPTVAPAVSAGKLVGAIEALSDDEVDRMIAARKKVQGRS
jgi:acyl carrier protein